MKKVPISLIIDDPAPLISVYYGHIDPPLTKDGRPLLPTFPNEMLLDFCDVIERNGIKGKFSVVPMPSNKGDIVNGLAGVEERELRAWLDVVKTRVMKFFTVGPEVLSHHKAVDLATGMPLDEREDAWSYHQDRTTLTPYIARALTLLRDVGIDAIGLTSPWAFGITVEEEYVAAISAAVKEVSGSNEAWYFLRSLYGKEGAKPWVALDEDGRTVVSIPATTQDMIWRTIDSTDTSEAFVSQTADGLITADGKAGQIVKALDEGGWPIIVTHWQSLASNGLYTGLRVLDLVGKRVKEHLSDRVEWKSFEEILRIVVADKASYPTPALA